MTRAKEITKEAKKFAKEIDDWEIAEDVQDAFEQGAQWADRTMIDKVCEWIKNANAAHAIVIRKGVYNMKEFLTIEFTDSFIEQFKKDFKL